MSQSLQLVLTSIEEAKNNGSPADFGGDVEEGDEIIGEVSEGTQQIYKAFVTATKEFNSGTRRLKILQLQAEENPDLESELEQASRELLRLQNRRDALEALYEGSVFGEFDIPGGRDITVRNGGVLVAIPKKRLAPPPPFIAAIVEEVRRARANASSEN